MRYATGWIDNPLRKSIRLFNPLTWWFVKCDCRRYRYSYSCVLMALWLSLLISDKLPTARGHFRLIKTKWYIRYIFLWPVRLYFTVLYLLLLILANLRCLTFTLLFPHIIFWHHALRPQFHSSCIFISVILHFPGAVFVSTATDNRFLVNKIVYIFYFIFIQSFSHTRFCSRNVGVGSITRRSRNTLGFSATSNISAGSTQRRDQTRSEM